MRGDRVLILKRSQRVRTNKDRWAGVSGYVEDGETPVETAYKELEEEVTARSDQVRLVRQADPLTFRDREHDTTWVVHPFLFEDLGVDVRLDWEHTKATWIEPRELHRYETVKSLERTLEAALDRKLR
jgi:8-oxo-dGTP pyrophosphatase MutT (NUDIX family)